MGDIGDGWHTVMPTSHTRIDRLPKAHVESYERQILAEWEASQTSWSGM